MQTPTSALSLSKTGTYHYFQCLNPACIEQVVVDVRRETVVPDMTMDCPCCKQPMICDGTAAADESGYDTAKAVDTKGHVLV